MPLTDSYEDNMVIPFIVVILPRVPFVGSAGQGFLSSLVGEGGPRAEVQPDVSSGEGLSAF